MRYFICWEWTPKFLYEYLIDTSSSMMATNYEWIYWLEILSSFVGSVEVDWGRDWAWPWSIFTWDNVGVEAKQPSLMRPFWRSHSHTGGGDEVFNQRYLIGGCDRLLHQRALWFTLLSWFPVCMQWWYWFMSMHKKFTPGGNGGSGRGRVL